MMATPPRSPTEHLIGLERQLYKLLDTQRKATLLVFALQRAHNQRTRSLHVLSDWAVALRNLCEQAKACATRLLQLIHLRLGYELTAAGY